jgi:hypothetical protein
LIDWCWRGADVLQACQKCCRNLNKNKVTAPLAHPEDHNNHQEQETLEQGLGPQDETGSGLGRKTVPRPDPAKVAGRVGLGHKVNNAAQTRPTWGSRRVRVRSGWVAGHFLGQAWNNIYDSFIVLFRLRLMILGKSLNESIEILEWIDWNPWMNWLKLV